MSPLMLLLVLSMQQGGDCTLILSTMANTHVFCRSVPLGFQSPCALFSCLVQSLLADKGQVSKVQRLVNVENQEQVRAVGGVGRHVVGVGRQ